MRKLVVILALVLGACEPAPPLDRNDCKDYRWMTYYTEEQSIVGHMWWGPAHKRVCVISESKTKS